MSTARKLSRTSAKTVPLFAEIDLLRAELAKRDIDVTSIATGFVAPQAIELEAAIIGACLIDAAAFPVICDTLKTPDFYVEANGVIFDAMQELKATSSPIDILTVRQLLFDKKQLDEIGGVYALMELSNKAANGANIEYHARIVKQKARARDLIAIATNAIRDSYEGAKDIFDIYADVEKSLQIESLNPLFVGGKASDVMKLAATAKDIENLCGNLFKTGDLALFLAPKKTGKTVIAYQMADAISRGVGVFGGLLDNVCGAKRTMYVDMEMNLSDFKNRYINLQSMKGYEFSDNLIIKMVNPENFNFEQDEMLKGIEKMIITEKPEVLFIDNLTALMKSISDADSALHAVKTFLMWKFKYNVSICIMCHTPKSLGNLPLVSDNILGSGIFLNLCTSVFGIRRSFTEKGIIYMKHLDTRNTEINFDTDNVIQMRIEKVDCFTQMVYEGQGREELHLAKKETDGEEIYDEAIKAYIAGESWAKIKTRLGYAYTPQALSKACIKYAERSKSFVYVASQQAFIPWFETAQIDIEISKSANSENAEPDTQ